MSEETGIGLAKPSQHKSKSTPKRDEVVDLTTPDQSPSKTPHNERRNTPTNVLFERFSTDDVGASLIIPLSQSRISTGVDTSGLSNNKSATATGNKDQDLVDILHEFPSNTLAMLRDTPLSTTRNMSNDTKDLWFNSTTRCPGLFASESGWKSGAPSASDLLVATQRLIANGYSRDDELKQSFYAENIPVFIQDIPDSSMDPFKVIAQLHAPNKANPVAIIGCRLPDLLPEDSMITPAALNQFVEPSEAKNSQILLTPKFWTTDLHIGMIPTNSFSMHQTDISLDVCDGLSIPIGPTEKIWIMFPPTSNNLRQMKSVEGQRGKLARIGAKMEGGLIFKTTSADAIYIPAGCIHAVFTVKGGFLISTEFLTSGSARPLSAFLNHDLDRFKGPTIQSQLPDRYLESIDLGLYGTKDEQANAIQAWVDSEARIRRWVDVNEDKNAATKNEEWMPKRNAWKRKVDVAWRNYFASGQSLKICPCGSMEPEEVMSEHFNATHAFTKRTPALSILKANSNKFKDTSDSRSVTPAMKKNLNGGSKKPNVLRSNHPLCTPKRQSSQTNEGPDRLKSTPATLAPKDNPRQISKMPEAGQKSNAAPLTATKYLHLVNEKSDTLKRKRPDIFDKENFEDPEA
ncbi:hypothetical protein LSUE1_G006060 [Lachnellula suecica]|uniref:JmjC domain-containing protein n=1 Tax=Lachnellula suecica TaxID=602035 RepID=A0A8T9C273_9HELO|nr:hypothetical protein LSUE1_G006060 [Lachnellula suecica]